jgi:hypothetical protein
MDRIVDYVHLRLVIREFGHEACASISDTDSELVLAAGAHHSLLDITLRVGFPIRRGVVAWYFLNGFADCPPASGAYKLKQWFPRRHALPFSINARVVGVGELS